MSRASSMSPPPLGNPASEIAPYTKKKLPPQKPCRTVRVICHQGRCKEDIGMKSGTAIRCPAPSRVNSTGRRRRQMQFGAARWRSGERADRLRVACELDPESLDWLHAEPLDIARAARRLASLWCGSTGNRWPQSRATSARNPASLRRPSRCRTTAMASSSPSVQAGAGPGRPRTAMAPARISGRPRRRRRAGLQLAAWGRPLRTRDFDNLLSSAEAVS
jgi:hypothetical protein